MKPSLSPKGRVTQDPDPGTPPRLPDRPPGPDGPPPPGLEFWRDRILRAFYLTAVFLGGLAYVPSMIYILAKGYWFLAAVDTAATAWGVAALIWWRRISFRIRATVTLGAIYVIAVLILGHLGPYSGGPVWLFTFGVAAGLLLGIRAAVAAVVLNALTLIALGGLVAGGLSPWPAVGPQPWLRWAVLSVNFVLLNALMAVSAAVLTRGLAASLRQEKTTLGWLRREVEERRRAEAEALEEKERFRVLVDEAPLGVALISPGGQYLYVNQMFRELFGYSLEDLTSGRSWFELAFPDPDYRTQVIDTWRTDIGEAGPGQSRIRVFWATARDGTEKLINFRSVGLASGEQLIIYEDITAREQAAKDLRRSEKRYRDLFDGITDYILTHDLQGRMLSLNRAVAAVFGRTPEELVGRAVTEVVSPGERDWSLDDYLARIIAGGRDEGVVRVQAPDGAERYVEYRASLVEDESGLTFVSATGRDVTERILAEREVRLLEEQLLQAQKMEAVGTLASGIAHDFNNILQAMGGYLQLIRVSDSPGAVLNYVDQIDRAVGRAGDLVRQVLTFSRRVERRFGPVDLVRELGQAADLLRRTLPKMIRIETRLTPDLRPILGDATQIEQVIMNLGANAKDAMPDGGNLLIEASNVDLDAALCRSLPDLTPGPYVHLRVADTGRGMDPDTLKHAFEPFFTTKGPGRGTGLGLSTVYGIVKSHEGSIQCHSRPEAGTRFEIYLPAADTVGRDTGRVPEDQVDPRGGNETVLIVDDEAPLLDVSRRILEAHGYSVLTAANGEEALDIHLDPAHRIDAVMLDLSMPGMGGYACLKKILEADPGAKVLVVSGYTAEGEVQKILEAGARGFLGKPHRLTEMLTILREVLDDDRTS
jgi:two-component system cell cycle sensor histidine kinase/response regulator CckA